VRYSLGAENRHDAGRPRVTDADTYRLSDRYTEDEGTVFMTGI